jgi:hypothetical protein
MHPRRTVPRPHVAAVLPTALQAVPHTLAFLPNFLPKGKISGGALWPKRLYHRHCGSDAGAVWRDSAKPCTRVRFPSPPPSVSSKARCAGKRALEARDRGARWMRQAGVAAPGHGLPPMRLMK